VVESASASATGNPGGLASASSGGPAVGVGPVLLPAHLDRPQIVTRASENRLVLAEFHKWGEPLNTNFARALAEGLAVLLATEHVAIFPWRRAVPVDYQLEVRVARFAAGPDDNVLLRCRWTLSDKRGRTLVTKASSFTEPASPQDYDATVAAMSQTVAALAREVATALQERVR
jgi:uncharacterized lipoprotein YmbA